MIPETQAQRTLLIDPTERDSNLRYLQNSKPSITLLGNFYRMSVCLQSKDYYDVCSKKSMLIIQETDKSSLKMTQGNPISLISEKSCIRHPVTADDPVSSPPLEQNVNNRSVTFHKEANIKYTSREYQIT